MRSYAVQVSWGGEPITGITTMTPLRTTTDVVTFHEGGSNVSLHVPGRSDTDTVTFSREVTADLAFDLWARAPLLRKAIELGLVDTTDGFTMTYRLPGCWVCGYVVAPDLETGGVAESLSVSTGPWQRITPPVAELAEHLAGERRRPMRRVSVAELLSRLQGEASARLDELLTEAEKAGAVLLLDEADALFSRRTGVRDAHDRYADASVDAVLDRLASYRGTVVVEPPD
ncbi:MAG: ATP-binding protein [Humibacillus sp.]|nr:ATP-binding protein [Humibacillus sp.]